MRPQTDSEHVAADFAARFLEFADLAWAAELLGDFPTPRPATSTPEGDLQ